MKIKKLERKMLKLFQNCLKGIACVDVVKFFWIGHFQSGIYYSLKNAEFIPAISGLYLSVSTTNCGDFFLNLEDCIARHGIVEDEELKTAIFKAMEVKAYEYCFKKAELEEELKAKYSFAMDLESKKYLIKQFVKAYGFEAICEATFEKWQSFDIFLSSDNGRLCFDFILTGGLEIDIETYSLGLKISDKVLFDIILFFYSLRRRPC